MSGSEDLEKLIPKFGNLNFQIRMNWEGSETKITYQNHLLLLTNFDFAPHTKKIQQQKLLSIYEFGKYKSFLDLHPVVVPTGIDLARSD